MYLNKPASATAVAALTVGIFGSIPAQAEEALRSAPVRPAAASAATAAKAGGSALAARPGAAAAARATVYINHAGVRMHTCPRLNCSVHSSATYDRLMAYCQTNQHTSTVTTYYANRWWTKVSHSVRGERLWISNAYVAGTGPSKHWASGVSIC